MNRSHKIRKVIGFLFIGTAAVLLFGFIVMSLWNGVLTKAIDVNTINFGQAIGILLLCKILFGGFGRGGGGWRRRGKGLENMKDKWPTMTPEEQERAKKDWRSRYDRWCRPEAKQEPDQ